MLVWKKVADRADIEKGKGKEFDVDGKKIAIFNHDGYRGIDAMCVHQD